MRLTIRQKLFDSLSDLEIDAIKQNLLDFGSETDENKDAIRSLALLTVQDKVAGSKPITGLGLEQTDVLLSDVAHEIEDLPIPDKLQKRLDLTQQQWDAATRVITLILLALEKNER